MGQRPDPMGICCLILSPSGDQLPVNMQETGKLQSNNIAGDRKIVV